MRRVAPHFFASDEFLQTVADVYFPGARPEAVECEGFHTRTLVHRGRPVTGFWWFSFPHPRTDPAQDARRVSRLEHAVVASETLPGPNPPDGEEVAPFIRWDGYASWDDYLAFAHSRGARRSSVRREERQLTAALGPVRFVPEDTDPAALRLALDWKAEHYARTGYRRLHIGQDREIYFELARRGLLHVSSLRAGDRTVAATFGYHSGRTSIMRLMAYDRSLAMYSPGAVHLHHLLRHRFESGDVELDFLSGREPFKYTYATHVRLLGSIGSEARADRFRRRARMRAGRLLAEHPALQRRARMVEAMLGRAVTRRRHS